MKGGIRDTLVNGSTLSLVEGSPGVFQRNPCRSTRLATCRELTHHSECLSCGEHGTRVHTTVVSFRVIRPSFHLRSITYPIAARPYTRLLMLSFC